MMELMKHKSQHASPAQEVSTSSDTLLPNPQPILSGPSPNAAPVPQEPVHKAQVTSDNVSRSSEAPKRELTPKEKEEAARAEEKRS
jgi:hypothetical protein